MNGKIGIFDSGIGGLSILKKLIEIMPNEDYIYYEDSINNPYGNKSDELLLKITSKIVDFLIKNNSKIIIIACNTASISCINSLRKMYPDILFVGTVPNIELACKNNSLCSCVLSTEYTSNSKYLSDLISKYKNNNQTIYNVSGGNLAHLIEIGDNKKISELLDDILIQYNNKIDSLVLGCTHYYLIRNEIIKRLPHVKIYDSIDDVVSQVNTLMKKYNLFNKNDRIGTVEIINNKDGKLIKRSKKILNKKGE